MIDLWAKGFVCVTGKPRCCNKKDEQIYNWGGSWFHFKTFDQNDSF